MPKGGLHGTGPVADKPETQIVRRRADRATATFAIADEVRHVSAMESLDNVHSAIVDRARNP